MSPKRKLDVLFMIHSVVALLCGLMAFIFPAVFEHFMIVHEYEALDIAHPGGEVKITHTVIRIYGMLLYLSKRACNAQTSRSNACRGADSWPSLDRMECSQNRKCAGAQGTCARFVSLHAAKHLNICTSSELLQPMLWCFYSPHLPFYEPKSLKAVV